MKKLFLSILFLFTFSSIVHSAKSVTLTDGDGNAIGVTGNSLIASLATGSDLTLDGNLSIGNDLTVGADLFISPNMTESSAGTGSTTFISVFIDGVEYRYEAKKV